MSRATSRWPLCALFAAFSYAALAGYDLLATRHLRHPLPFWKSTLAAFISYAFSNTVGFAIFSGGAMRFRVYSSFGMSAGEITQLVIFNAVTFWLGLLAVAGIFFVFDPPELVSDNLYFPVSLVQAIGVVFLVLLAGYLLLALLKRQSFKTKYFELDVPSFRMALAQLVVSALDWIGAAFALFVLFPSSANIPLGVFFGGYLLAQVAALISHLPAGVGVFDTVMILVVANYVSTPQALATLLVFRFVYYLLPFMLALLLLAILEFEEQRKRVAAFVRGLTEIAPPILPQFMAITTFVGGAMLLLAGSLPTPGWRLQILGNLLPLSVIELSHFGGSVIGLALLILAFGLSRRLYGAYVFGRVFLSLGIVVALFKALHYEEAVVLTVMLAALWPSRRYFYRKISLRAEPFALSWMIAILSVLIASLWLGLFAYKHIQYSHDLWWRFSLGANGPRFMRAALGSWLALSVFGCLKLFSHPRSPLLFEPKRDWPAVRAIVKADPHASAQLALLGDKHFMLSDRRDAFIMFGIEGNSWIAMGDPVGNEDSTSELAWKFREQCDLYRKQCVFYQVRSKYLELYSEMGLTPLEIGKEARINLGEFSVNEQLRNAAVDAEKQGYTVAVPGTEETAPELEGLARVSESWLGLKNTHEKQFSLGSFKPDYLKECRLAVARGPSGIEAFLSLWPGADHEEIGLDLLRRTASAPEAVLDYLVVRTMVWAKQQGYRWFNLGIAPAAGLAAQRLTPLRRRIRPFIFHRGEYYYNFHRPEQYQEKFNVAWSPVYLAAPATVLLPRVLINVSTLVSGNASGKPEANEAGRGRRLLLGSRHLSLV